MAAPQATESRAAVAGIGLAATLGAAKMLAIAGHTWPHSPWSVFAFFWQDVLVALVFAGVSRAAPAILVRSTYVAIVAYVAINMPVTLTLGSPMTWRMWSAADVALTDSARRELTGAALGATAVVVIVAAVVPLVLAGRRIRRPSTLAISAVAFVLVGWASRDRVDTAGRDRNAILALWPSPSVGVSTLAAAADLRRSLIVPKPPPAEDLAGLRGSARGLNVVVVVLESTAARYLKLYGSDDDPTPRLTTLGSSGVVFDAAYAVYPESIKGLFALLCGRAPAYDASAESDATMPCDSMAAGMARAGYRTGLFHSGRFDYLGMRAVVEGRGFETLEDAATIGGAVRSSFGVSEDATVSRMLAWIDATEAAAAAKPFFLMYLPAAGHHPYATESPGPYDGRTEARQYLNAIHEGDAALGQLVDGLRARGLDRRTLLVVLGDHGEAFGQHDGNSGHSLFIYDENVHVPLVIALPHATSVRVHRPISVVDLQPTIADLVGLRSGETDGASALDDSPRAAFFFADYSQPWVGLRDGCWTYVLNVAADRGRLFDVCADPNETVDRLTDGSQPPGEDRAYRARALQWLGSTRAPLTRSARSPSGRW